mgnify:CR=1
MHKHFFYNLSFIVEFLVKLRTEQGQRNNIVKTKKGLNYANLGQASDKRTCKGQPPRESVILLNFH